jgi:PKD repeat protein
MRPEGTIAPSAADVGKQVTITGGTGWTLGTYTISAFDNGYWVVASSPAAPGTSGGRFWTTAVPNYNQAIGVTKDRVEGTDKFVPKFEFSITVKTYPVTLEFLRTVRSIVGKTNDAAWRGFAAGELLYMGMTGQCEPNNFWTLTHKFAAGENLTVQVTPDLKIDKGAWEYLWCTYQQTVLNGVALQVPRAAYVEKIYDSADFNTLRLNPPVCNWTSDVYGGMHPLTVAFTDLSTGTPLEWLWTFGDGTTSSLRNPVKTYMIPGTYTVSLTVTNGAGSSFKTVANYVTVS